MYGLYKSPFFILLINRFLAEGHLLERCLCIEEPEMSGLDRSGDKGNGDHEESDVRDSKLVDAG